MLFVHKWHFFPVGHEWRTLFFLRLDLDRFVATSSLHFFLLFLPSTIHVRLCLANCVATIVPPILLFFSWRTVVDPLNHANSVGQTTLLFLVACVESMSVPCTNENLFGYRKLRMLIFSIFFYFAGRATSCIHELRENRRDKFSNFQWLGKRNFLVVQKKDA